MRTSPDQYRKLLVGVTGEREHLILLGTWSRLWMPMGLLLPYLTSIFHRIIRNGLVFGFLRLFIVNVPLKIILTFTETSLMHVKCCKLSLRPTLSIYCFWSGKDLFRAIWGHGPYGLILRIAPFRRIYVWQQARGYGWTILTRNFNPF
jgi:hypothetical protein